MMAHAAMVSFSEDEMPSLQEFRELWFPWEDEIESDPSTADEPEDEEAVWGHLHDRIKGEESDNTGHT